MSLYIRKQIPYPNQICLFSRVRQTNNGPEARTADSWRQEREFRKVAVASLRAEDLLLRVLQHSSVRGCSLKR